MEHSRSRARRSKCVPCTIQSNVTSSRVGATRTAGAGKQVLYTVMAAVGHVARVPVLRSAISAASGSEFKFYSRSARGI